MNKPEANEEILNSEQQRLVLDAALSVISKGGFTATIAEKVAERCAIAAPRIFLHSNSARRRELAQGDGCAERARFPVYIRKGATFGFPLPK
jgi:hypothetical protein